MANTTDPDALSRFEITSADIEGLENKESQGSGSFGAVYAVKVRGVPRIAKRLHSILVSADVSQSERQGIRDKFLCECLLLSKLDHPNIVKFVGVHFNPEDRSDVTLIMERLCMDLENFLNPEKHSGDIDTFTKLCILLDVSSGLLYLHSQSENPVIHRDLTAGNVLLTEDLKRAKIADLGVSKLIDNHAQSAVTRTVCPGTIAYMPPEALMENPRYDTPLDVFSFGQLALYLAIQEFPLVYEISSEHMIEAYKTGEVAIRRRSKWIDMLPVDHCLRSIILRCLKDDPLERPSTEELNVKMKVLCGLELKEFEIKDIVVIQDGKSFGSYGVACEVIARGAPRIAKRLSSILKLQHGVSSSERQKIRERFHCECLSLSKLDHPNIVKFIGVHFDPKYRFDVAIIMEYLHASLEECLDAHDSFNPHLHTKLSILHDVSSGLFYLHTQWASLFHGELTAANVLLTEDLRQAKIADLGISRVLSKPANVQDIKSRALTYLPPEAFTENPKYGEPLDVFSFGQLALYVVLQQFPEISHKTLTTSRKKRGFDREVLKRKEWIDQLSQDHCLRDLILNCLKDEPEKRPTTSDLNSVMNVLIKTYCTPKENKHEAAFRKRFGELCRLCRNGQLLQLKDAICYNNEILTYSTSAGVTLLHEAVNADQPDIVQLLLLYGFNPDIRAREGQTPLHVAVSKGYVGCVRALIENGADITVKDNSGQDAIPEAVFQSKKPRTVMNLLRSKEIVLLAENGDLKKLKKCLMNIAKPELRYIEEAMLIAIRKGNDECVRVLIVAGARRLDCALCLAIQMERIEVIALLILCKATVAGDATTLRLLLFEPLESKDVPWYILKVHEVLSQYDFEMDSLIAVSIAEKKYEASKELLLRTNVDMARKQVDWSGLKLTILDPSWIYSIAPWVVSLNLVNNHLQRLPREMYYAMQLRRLDLSQNLLETVSADIFALQSLEYLSLRHNQLKDLPETSNWSKSLISLDLSENLLSNLPQDIQHSHIEMLNLSRNRITAVPMCLCRIHTLTSLDLSYMPISALPKELEDLDHLVNLKAEGVPQGRTRVAIRHSHKPCNHVKLVLLSNTNNGKMVMLSKLNPNFSLSRIETKQTLPEIDCFRWNFKPLFTRKVLVSPKLCFNTWFLGSPPSCWSIYPCFFTISALYVIVCDLTLTCDLRDQVKVYIDLIIRYVPSANVLIIAIPPEQYKSTKLAETLALRLGTFFSKPSCQTICYHGFLIANSSSKDDIKQRLYDTAQQMLVNGQLVAGRLVPETYLSLIPIIEKEQEVLQSQSKPGVMEEDTLWMLFNRTFSSDPPGRMELPTMVEFLSEAGFLLHYDDPNHRLDQWYFTRPVWLYNTLLRIVHYAVEYHNCLFFTNKELCSLLSVGSRKDICQSLIRLMIRYAIVLPTGQDRYLMPCLLPHYTPPFELLYCGMLRRQFAPKLRSIPVDLWRRLLCSVIANLPRITDMRDLRQVKSTTATNGQKAFHSQHAMSEIKRVHGEKSESPAHTDAVHAPPLFVVAMDEKVQLKQWSPRHTSLPQSSQRVQRNSKRHASSPSARKRNSATSSINVQPAVLSRGVEVWKTGMIYNSDGIRFSIYPCVSEVSTGEERGIEICCTQDSLGYVIMARLCWLVQMNLEERFPHLFSTDTLLQKHELSQIAMCPTCLKMNEQNPSCFLVEACVHALQLKDQLHCRNHHEVIPLRDLVPDYLLVDFPSHFRLTKEMFEYDEANPLHKGRQVFLYDGHFNGQEVAIKVYKQIHSRSTTLPLGCVRKEVDMLTSIDHPNIVKIFGFCLNPACVLIERAPLGNLHEKLIDTERRISRIVRFHISCQVASALHYLHGHNIIYRTLKATSILLWSLNFNCEASIKLGNFERAVYQSPSGLMGKTNFSSYPAPEMLKNSFKEEYTEKVDIYSFGILLYEIVTRWQPYGEAQSGNYSQKPKISDMASVSYKTMVKRMEDCWQEESMARPSASDLLLQLSKPSLQCHIASQVLHECVSVRGCCFVPSVRQIWVYGEYNKPKSCREMESSDGTLVFVLNAENLTVQGSLELTKRATAMCTVDNKVWIGMTELCIHTYDTITFRFTDRFYLDDSATAIACNDCYVCVGQANGHLKCYSKLELQRGDSNPTDVRIGDKAIIAMVTIGDIIWLGCSNELVIISAEEEIIIEQRTLVCDTTDHVYYLAVSSNSNTVWCLTANSHNITSWDAHTTEIKSTIDLSQELKLICCEMLYDPSFLQMVSIECVSDTLWVGLSSGVVMILTDDESPREIFHFRAHKQATECLLKIPNSAELFQQHNQPTIFSGGYGEISSLSNIMSEHNGVVMLWHAFTANEFSTVSKRHNKYSSAI